MTVESLLIVLLLFILLWVVVLIVKEFSTANRKIEAIFDAESAEKRERETQELLAVLSLYLSYHAWTQLTTEQKELLADAIDEAHRRQDIEDGYASDSTMAYAPTKRWWRE